VGRKADFTVKGGSCVEFRFIHKIESFEPRSFADLTSSKENPLNG